MPGSDDSALSSTSSGLRRVPIPVERFLKGSSLSIHAPLLYTISFSIYLTHYSHTTMCLVLQITL